AVNSRSRFKPALCRSFPGQARCVELDGARYYAIFESRDVPFRATVRGLDVFHWPAVISLAFKHDMTIHCVQVAVDDAVICARVLVAVGSAGWRNIVESPIQYERRISGLFLGDVMREGNADAFLGQSE